MIRIVGFASLIAAAGCCDKPNPGCPRAYEPIPGVRTVAYGDSITKRYQGALAGLLGGDLALEGVHLRTAQIARYTRENSANRCESPLCTLDFSCLCNWPTLESVLEKYPDTDRLIVTLGGNDLVQDVWMQSIVVPAVDDPVVTVATEKLANSLDELMAIATRSVPSGSIYLTSYPYLAMNRTWPDSCAWDLPLSPQDQKRMNALIRLWATSIEDAAGRHGAHYIGLVETLGGGEPLGEDGETGPDATLFEDCVHPAAATGGALLADAIHQSL